MNLGELISGLLGIVLTLIIIWFAMKIWPDKINALFSSITKFNIHILLFVGAITLAVYYFDPHLAGVMVLSVLAGYLITRIL